MSLAHAAAPDSRHGGARSEPPEPQLLGIMAHEVANAVAPLRMHARILAGAQLPPGARASAEAVLAIADRLGWLSSEMLETARLRSLRLTLDPADLDLQEEARRAVQALAPLAIERRVDLRVEPMPACPARADPGRMQQLLANLVTNALQATPAGGKVRVRVERVGPKARIEVTDTGVGLEPQEAQRLFEPFTRSSAGLGLGLFICRGIVEAHGGRIWCESQGRGMGSAFVAEIPVLEGVAPWDAAGV